MEIDQKFATLFPSIPTGANTHRRPAEAIAPRPQRLYSVLSPLIDSIETGTADR